MKAKPHIPASLLAISLLCIALNASAVPSTPITNIVTNGGFEAGNFNGWTLSGNTDFTNGEGSGNIGVDNDSAHSGTYGAFFGPVGSLAYLSQNLSTVAGMTYDLSFFLLNEGSGGQSIGPVRPGGEPVGLEFQVFWNGTLIFSIPPNSSPSVYSQLNFTGLVATGASTELRVGFRNDPSFWNIDDIVAGASSVPEVLSTIWLALPVVGMFGFLRLRRKSD
jgi:hypothetical protein